MDNSVKNINGSESSADVAKQPLAAEDKAESACHAPAEKKHRTAGNKIYDFGVFGTFAWLGVSFMSFMTANEAMNGNNKHFDWLRKLNTSAYNGISKVFSKTILKNSSPEVLHGASRNMAMVFILGMGGHTMMGPIKWLEDHRQSNAAKIDKLLGTTPPEQEAIEKEPKQSWKSVLSGRMISWGSCFAVIAAMGPKLTSKVNDYFGEKGANAFIKIRPHSDAVKVRRWSDLIAFDVLATALTAGVTWACSRFFAKKHDKNLDNVEDSLYQLNPAAPNPLGNLDEPDEKQRNFTDKAKMRDSSIRDSGATAFIDKIKRDERSHEAAASFIDKIQAETGVSHHALS